MTGSYFARAATLDSGVVTISGDYRGCRELSGEGAALSSPRNVALLEAAWNRGTNRRGRTDEGVCPYAPLLGSRFRGCYFIYS
jgi:hypothetical protein